ncbi:synaptonemal complex protein 2-like isoform X2 [Sceloporus undulatus]|nr:synaptonemal complex protein 2-like isoform X2 [Sceloporus undulatus]
MKKQKKSKVLEAKKASPSMSVRRTFQQTEIINNMMPISKNQSDSDRGKQAQPTRLKQKRKAALVKKSYKELSDSETDSEEESSEHLLKRGTLKYPEPKNIKKKAAHKLKENQSIVSSETTKGILINQPKRSSKSKDSGLKRQMDLSSLSSFENPASPEILRCCEKYGLEQSTEEHISPGRSSLSSLLTPEKELISEKEKSLDDIKNMSGIAEINNESIQLKQLSEKGRKLVFGIEDLSPVSSSFSLPNLSSLTTRKKNTSNQDADITKLEEKTYDTNEATSTKHYPLNKSSDIELKDFSENPMGSRGEAPTSVSQSSTPSKEELCHEELLAHIHESGPTVHSNFKRLYQEETEADSDEEEIRREKMKTKLLPRKLFKTDENTYKVSESISTLSINDTTGFDGEGWDADSSSVGMICQKVHQELARKIQSRTKRMDSFTKQSLKTTYQHMNTMNSELHKQRAKQLENLHSCLVKEIESFERDSQALRNMEKDFSNFSKKQSETFRTYNKNEQQRLQNLKISFEKNIYDTADCEETFFTSKMHQMKADMKGIQERFLKEMHEEELLNVRKGLQSLFMDENRNF